MGMGCGGWRGVQPAPWKRRIHVVRARHPQQALIPVTPWNACTDRHRTRRPPRLRSKSRPLWERRQSAPEHRLPTLQEHRPNSTSFFVPFLLVSTSSSRDERLLVPVATDPSYGRDVFVAGVRTFGTGDSTLPKFARGLWQAAPCPNSHAVSINAYPGPPGSHSRETCSHFRQELHTCVAQLTSEADLALPLPNSHASSAALGRRRERRGDPPGSQESLCPSSQVRM